MSKNCQAGSTEIMIPEQKSIKTIWKRKGKQLKRYIMIEKESVKEYKNTNIWNI